jgi:chromosomal replication initiator protein
MDKLIENWDIILKKVKEDHDITDIAYHSWLEPLQIHNLQNGILYLLVPLGSIAINYLTKKNFDLLLKVAIAEVTGIECEIQFISEENADTYTAPAEKAVSTYSENSDLTLNPNYTFETFVVGSNNRYAHSAALAVAESPGEIYNPLFLYGGVGLGKTHLMQSIAHYIKKKNPNALVRYVSSETFTNELIEAIRNSNNQAMSKFREKYRNIDALLIDDIQFIIGKESTQEEFFHTFNELHLSQKAIIISSDRPPKDMPTLEDRIRTRLSSGLISDIGAPDYETRMAILKKKEELDGFKIDEEILQYIATNIKSNIRELEGALNKLLAYSNLEKKEITMEVAKKELQSIISPDAPKEITVELILSVVAEHFQVSVEDICSSKRTADITFPRQIAMYLCRKMTAVPLQTIGAKMGKKDHTTVMHGHDKIEAEIKTNENTANIVETIRKKINPS